LFRVLRLPHKRGERPQRGHTTEIGCRARAQKADKRGCAVCINGYDFTAYGSEFQLARGYAWSNRAIHFSGRTARRSVPTKKNHNKQAYGDCRGNKDDQTRARLIYRIIIQISVFLLVASKGYAPSGLVNNPTHYFINQKNDFSIERA